jgi:hypothetical protein
MGAHWRDDSRLARAAPIRLAYRLAYRLERTNQSITNGLGMTSDPT